MRLSVVSSGGKPVLNLRLPLALLPLVISMVVKDKMSSAERRALKKAVRKCRRIIKKHVKNSGHFELMRYASSDGEAVIITV